MERPDFIENYLSGKAITPEQQGKLKQYAGSLSELVHHSDHFSMKWGVLQSVTNVVCDQFEEHPALLRGQQVIEIGPGCNPLAAFLLRQMGVRKYVGVEPLRPELTRQLLDVSDSRSILEHTDGLTYLFQQPDESAIVMSFGVLDPTIYQFLPFNTSGISWKQQEIDDYMRLLIKEIYRVTPHGSVTMHHPSGEGAVRPFFEKAGFLCQNTYEMSFFKP